jgi:hypothetical protein
MRDKILNGSGIIIDFVMMLLLLLSYYCNLLDLVQTELSRPHMLHVYIIVITSLEWTFSNREADTSVDSRELRPFTTLDSRISTFGLSPSSYYAFNDSLL